MTKNEPKLQTLPLRTRLGQRIAKEIRPQLPETWPETDYASIEESILAHLSDGEHEQ